MLAHVAQLITAAVAPCGAVCTVYLWVTRQIIRSEIGRLWQREIAPMRQDVTVLRTAVFNHLAHQEQPVEAHIREVLGFGERML